MIISLTGAGETLVPAISSVTPSAVTTGTPTQLTIQGTNLQDVTSVTIDGVAATALSVISATQVQCTSPAVSGAGQKAVVVSTPEADSAAFFISATPPAPTITLVSPNQGGAGSVLNIWGTEFTAGATVTIGGISASVVVNSVNNVTVTVPNGVAGGLQSIVLTTTGGQATASYTHYLPPTVASISPTQGGVGTTLNVAGAHFVTTPGGIAAKVGPQNAACSATSSTTAVITVPEGVPSGLNSISVVTVGGTGVLPNAYNHFLAPTISSVSPSSGKTGDVLTVTGTNFHSGSTATVGGLSASVSISSTQSLTLTVPSGLSAGIQTIAVSNIGGSASVGGLYQHYVPPVINGISPAQGGTGTQIEVTGSNFVAGQTSAAVAGISAQVTVTSGSLVTVTIPAGMTTAGAKSITITTPGGTASTNAYTHFLAPTISSVSPSSGKTGDVLTVTGTNFSTNAGDTTVTIGGVTASTTVSSSTVLTVTVPTIATGGSKNVTVTAPGGTATSTSAYTHFLAPTISSVSPSSGKTGDVLTVTGTNFVVGSTTATVGGVSATCSASSTTSCSVTVPSISSAGAKSITISTTGGTATASNAYTHYLAPTITSYSPANGTANTAATVTINGTNFTSATTVTVNGSSRSVSYNASNRVTVSFQSLARGTYLVVLSTQGGSVSSNYTYTLVPTLSSISPTTTFYDGGLKTYTLTGSNFLSAGVVASSAVDVAGTNYSASISTETTMTFSANLSTPGTYNVRVKAPDGNSSTVSVTSNWRPAPTITSVTSNRGIAGTALTGTSITVTGTNFTFGTTTVTFGGATVNPVGLTATGFSFSVPTLSTDGVKTLTVATSGSNNGSASNSSITYYAARAAETSTFNAAGTFSVPAWCNSFDVVCLGGGQGGGKALAGFNGGGGRAGSFAANSYSRATIGWGVTSISCTPGSGSSGATAVGHAVAGSPTTAEGVNVSVSAPGGPGGNSNSTQPGSGSGNYTFNGVTYTGSTATSPAASAGVAPGGGGGGGSAGANGFAGATGRVWIRAYQ